MMSKQLFISSFLIIFFLSTNIFPEEKAQRTTGSLTITSETLTADNNAHSALFEKSVVARTAGKTLYADRMLVFYDPETGDMTKAEAKGSVKYVVETDNGSRVITSSEATYYADEEKVIFTGEPRATDGENVVTGTKITYLVNEDRYFVEKSRVFLKKKNSR